ncbi:MAG: NADH-quinone oxidoreductase subunit K [Gammaproteobacteria bacterium]|nr:NADH-quinone oxidoreductase subunit K [Gammaproteobacteria bacterium]MCP5137743.1 NADH-quinone oxidoreductase subunit K [Gammaproteobacteria bacterium]
MIPELHVGWVLFAGAIGLIAIGVGGLLMSRDLFRVVLALAITEAGANLLLVLSGYRFDAIAPIVTNEVGGVMVDPVPQAMVLTAIVIGVGVQALALGLVLRIYRAYGSIDVAEVRRRMDDDIAAEAGLPLPSGREKPAVHS